MLVAMNRAIFGQVSVLGEKLSEFRRSAIPKLIIIAHNSRTESHSSVDDDDQIELPHGAAGFSARIGHGFGLELPSFEEIIRELEKLRRSLIHKTNSIVFWSE